jgi:hypothetical protein
MTTFPVFRPVMTSTSQRIGLLSTYPPKICGLATFASALERELVSAGHRVDVVRVDDGDGDFAIGKAVAGTGLDPEGGCRPFAL